MRRARPLIVPPADSTSLRGCLVSGPRLRRMYFCTLMSLFALLAAFAPAAPAWDRGNLADYHERRAQLVNRTGDGVVVLFGYNDEDVAASVTTFRQNEEFYYLTGWMEPGAILMLTPKAAGPNQPPELGGEILY